MWLWSAKPACAEASARLAPDAIRRRAASMRRCIWYACGVKPVSLVKERISCQGLMPHSAARSAREVRAGRVLVQTVPSAANPAEAVTFASGGRPSQTADQNDEKLVEPKAHRRRLNSNSQLPHKTEQPRIANDGTLELIVEGASHLELCKDGGEQVRLDVQHPPGPRAVADRAAVMHLARVGHDEVASIAVYLASPASPVLAAILDDAESVGVMRVAVESPAGPRVDHLGPRTPGLQGNELLVRHLASLAAEVVHEPLHSCAQAT